MCLHLTPLIASGPNAMAYFKRLHDDFRSQWLVLLLQVQNYYFDINADIRMFPHLWYLSVDFQFFLVTLPILLLLRNRPKISVAIFALLSLVGCSVSVWQVAGTDMTPFVVVISESITPSQGSPWSASRRAESVPLKCFLKKGVSSLPVTLVPTDGGAIRLSEMVVFQEELRNITGHFLDISDVGSPGCRQPLEEQDLTVSLWPQVVGLQWRLPKRQLCCGDGVAQVWRTHFKIQATRSPLVGHPQLSCSVSMNSARTMVKTGYLYYFYPFYHAVCYFSGCITFFLVAWFKEKKIPKVFQLIAWLVAIASGLCCVFMKTVWYRTNDPTTELGKLSTTFFDRILWSIFLTWITLACATGRGGFLCTFLSWSAFTPLSRLAFGVYIVHLPFVQFALHMSRERLHYSHFFMVSFFFGVLVWSYLISYFLFIFCEAPTGRLDKLMFEPRRSAREKQVKDSVPNANAKDALSGLHNDNGKPTSCHL
ncbi:hypothetical protein MRX96_014320 [Rhipicephalus microplus]